MNPRTRSTTDGRMRRPVPPSGFARIGQPDRPMLAVGVGHHEQAFPHMWGTHGARGKHAPLRIEPERGQVTEQPPESDSISKESCDVLHEHVPRSYLANHVEEPRPSPPLVSDPTAAARRGEWLAGETSGDHVNRGTTGPPPPGGGGANVVMAGHLRPMSGKNRAAERVDLDLPDHAHPRALQTQVEPADAGEQRQHVEATHAAPPRSRSGNGSTVAPLPLAGWAGRASRRAGVTLRRR